MSNYNNNRFAAYFSLEKELKLSGHYPERAELISEFTSGKKTSLRALEYIEYTNFIKWIRNTFQFKNVATDWQNKPENIMRRKLWVIFCKEMGYTTAEYENWVVKYGQFHRPIKAHTKEQLQLLVVQAEKVLKSFTKSI